MASSPCGILMLSLTLGHITGQFRAITPSPITIIHSTHLQQKIYKILFYRVHNETYIYIRKNKTLLVKIIIFFLKITPTTVQICRLENIEHKNMKQVSYSGKYSLYASRAHQSVVGDVFCQCFLHV